MCTVFRGRNFDGIKVCFERASSCGDEEDAVCVSAIRPYIENSSEFTTVGAASGPSKDFGGYRGLYGRRLNSRQVDFDLLRSWFHHCETRHGDIFSEGRLISPMKWKKIRLLDFLKRQIVDSTMAERYLALSYVWGQGQQLSLTKLNYEELRLVDSLKDKDMTRTIWDTFDVFAKIGERYP
ncbi:hypothetical protein L207DRAFT_581488 [Hyaloscypha variabilis F]|jgi:hypothetical protein|uniref:Heterokaryon incompatibility domain-containing protein n=1 Tax=Hyaloscypha variabilis (strain UAMH 11265 / GT02V1 / F) TaxID=1149755 RepID=A0A2J6RWF1_HYAVF|nr:hypothetical protein L207DRAFT_581488 [Hyaloscypha variabilis F]